jgi:Plant transposon protein
MDPFDHQSIPALTTAPNILIVRSHNNQSSMFDDNAVRGEAQNNLTFAIKGNQYNVAYWLADGIYPFYACFVKLSPNPTVWMQKCLHQSKRRKEKIFPYPHIKVSFMKFAGHEEVLGYLSQLGGLL